MFFKNDSNLGSLESILISTILYYPSINICGMNEWMDGHDDATLYSQRQIHAYFRSLQ